MSEGFRVAAQFRGPDGSGNGGYVAGRAALLLGDGPGEGASEVTLRRPMPLDTTLTVRREAGAAAVLDAEGNVVVEAKAAALELEVPPAPSRAEAEAATRWFLASGLSHSRGLCFCCGDNQAQDYGLRVFTGKVEGRPGLAAALWQPDPAFAVAGRVAPEHLWAALDCAGQFAFAVDGQPYRSLLARITASLTGSVEPGEPCLVLGWQIAREDRKLHAGTAILGADGGVRGLARALWVMPRPVAG
jgi:hypothetical protein